MLKIIKKFFDDNDKIVGLCAFNKKRAYADKADFFLYYEVNKKGFVPRIDNNILLI